MKNVLKSLPEPQELVDYRARFARAPNPRGWNGFKADPRRREPIKNQLRADQRGLCAYCESTLFQREESVEHIILRWMDHSRELDWNNLLLCCDGGSKPLPEGLSDFRQPAQSSQDKSCGHARLGNPAPILDPLHLPPFPCLFRFRSETGEICPDENACRTGAIDANLAGQTVTVLGLRAGRLNRARYAVLDEILRQLASDGAAPAFSPARAQEIAAEQIPSTGHLPAFFTTIRWALGAGAENHLRATGYQG
jgi:uncharacterized protein (TIGR02646 family)